MILAPFCAPFCACRRPAHLKPHHADRLRLYSRRKEITMNKQELMQELETAVSEVWAYYRAVLCIDDGDVTPLAALTYGQIIEQLAGLITDNEKMKLD